ncbi:hypothetical protein AAU61_16930 [Desulfocarbo indianensis]|nr:hypothetical protein AAU61_16930 [Desulfocarbo indianensis]
MKKTPSTKIELNANKVARIQDMEELARLLFPGNRNHQRIFLAVFIELKYAPGQYMPSLDHLCQEYDFTKRILETVRSKMRRMGLIDHVSRFNPHHGYREGWVFSSRFNRTLGRLSNLLSDFKDRKGTNQEKKDRDLFRYL